MNNNRTRLPQNLREKLHDHARTLRTEMSPAEKQLWPRLRGDQLDGHRFRRQHVIGPYIADFFCNRANLVIEIDGDSHADQVAYDKKRDDYLRRQFLRVLRFTNSDIASNIDGVLTAILEACRSSSLSPPRGEGWGEGPAERIRSTSSIDEQRTTPSPPPSPRGGEREAGA